MNLSTCEQLGIVAVNRTSYVEAMFSCMEAGNVAVPLREAEDRYRISTANVNQIVIPAASGAWMRREFSPPKTDAVALISFTSGTEGNPKGVILTHRNLADVVTRLNSLMQLDDSISEYIGVPVYHSFGFGRCRAVATTGGRFFIPNDGFNPSEIGAMLRSKEINAISAVPSLWRVLLANKDLIGNYGKRVRWIEIGSQYMSRQEKEELKALFPEARIVQHYGLTEASRTTLLEIHEAEGDELESVGRALGTVAIKLTQEGQIAIRGEHVAQGYLIDGNISKIQDNDGWFLTKDLGALENGYLYYKGRADDVINCGGIKVHPEALETKIYASIGYSNGLAICRKKDPMRGEGFLIAVTKNVNVDKHQLREAVLQATQELGVNAASAITIIDVDSLPRTATGKIERRKLAEWYTLQTPCDGQLINTPSSDCSPIQTIFCRILNLHKVQPQDTFISLGGDSLSYVQFSMQLERYLGYVPREWEHIPVQEMEKLEPQRKRKHTIEASIFLRAIAICAIVFNHASFVFNNYLLHDINGASMLLLIIAGLNFARFQKCSLFKRKFSSAIMPLLRNILIPYLGISVIFQVLEHKWDFSTLFLIDNFFHFRMTDLIIFPFPFWFIQVLVQCVIGFTLLLTIRPLHRLAYSSPWKFGLVLMILGVLTSVISIHLLYSSEINQFPRLPHVLFWLFALGWCIHFAQSKAKKSITIIAAFISLCIFALVTHKITLEDCWILFGGVILIWLPYISIPSIIKPNLQTISAAAYYLYLTHMIFFCFLRAMTGSTNSLLHGVVAILGGVIIWGSVQALHQFRWPKIGRRNTAKHPKLHENSF